MFRNSPIAVARKEVLLLWSPPMTRIQELQVTVMFINPAINFIKQKRWARSLTTFRSSPPLAARKEVVMSTWSPTFRSPNAKSFCSRQRVVLTLTFTVPKKLTTSSRRQVPEAQFIVAFVNPARNLKIFVPFT